MATTTKVTKFTAKTSGNDRTFSVPYGKNDLSVDDFDGLNAKMAAVFTDYSGLGKAWTEIDTKQDEILINDI